MLVDVPGRRRVRRQLPAGGHSVSHRDDASHTGSPTPVARHSPRTSPGHRAVRRDMAARAHGARYSPKAGHPVRRLLARARTHRGALARSAAPHRREGGVAHGGERLGAPPARTGVRLAGAYAAASLGDRHDGISPGRVGRRRTRAPQTRGCPRRLLCLSPRCQKGTGYAHPLTPSTGTRRSARAIADRRYGALRPHAARPRQR